MRHYLDLALAAVLAVVVCVAVALLVPTLEEVADESLILANATIAGAPISALFTSFLFYSFLGWVFESVLCSLVNLGHFTNCGFLLGPYCPIYGTGALACWLLLRGFDSVPALFVVSALVCCCIEYAVGWALEKTTHVRFWDYSNLPLNLHGRVCQRDLRFFNAFPALRIIPYEGVIRATELKERARDLFRRR